MTRHLLSLAAAFAASALCLAPTVSADFTKITAGRSLA
jgi:hypothetical protein